MYKFLFLIFILSSSAFAQQVMWTTINHTPERRSTLSESLQKLKGDFTFNYFAKYLGSSLSPDMQEGSTFNRFKTGQNRDGFDQDFRGAHQTFQSFSLGYNLTKDVNLNFTHTFQYDENNGVEYEYVSWDKKKYTGTRVGGTSFNNQRLNLNVRNIINNEVLYLNTNFHYEHPTTEISEANEMMYGVGFLATIGFYNGTPGLSYGLRAMAERDVYPDDEYYSTPWCAENSDICNSTQMQTTRIGLGTWLGYMINDDYSLSASVDFDWDQDGDQVGSTDFNPNMDDIASMSLNYRLNSNISIAGGVEASVTVPAIDRTAVFGTLNLRL